MGEPIRVTFQRMDPGQTRLAKHPARHKVIRCGRRRGKTTFGEILTCDTAMKPVYIGWFVPEYRFLAEVWRNLRYRLAPMIRKANDSEHRIELVTGAVIEGWPLANNPDAGRSRKYDLAIVDECGLIEGMRRWWDSALEATLIDRSGRAVMLGTPHAISPDFDDFYDRAAADTSGEWAAFTETTFDNPHLPLPELAKIRAKRNSMPEWLWLQEYMAIPADNASGFFPRSVIRKHIETHACDPVVRGDLVIDATNDTERHTILEKRLVDRIRWVDDPRGPWRLWFPDGGLMRPNQETAWCFGADIGAGVGAANSVIAAADADTGVKWAEYASPGVTPERFAEQTVAAGIWFGGRLKVPLLQFEVNGGGEVYARTVLNLSYPRVCSHNVRPGDVIKDTPSNAGWRSSPQAKETMLSEYRGALAYEKYINPSEQALNETGTYRFGKSGKLESVPLAGSEEAFDDARAPHGDRVVADALAYDAIRGVPSIKMEEPPPPKGGIWERVIQTHKARKKAKKLTF